MTLTASPEPAILPRGTAVSRNGSVLALLGGLWLLLFFASLFAPPVLDDADGTHANAARQMALSGDFVTLRVNNVRYLEKAPLPYWIAALSFRVFGFNTFAAHLPEALGVLALMLLGFRWSREAFGDRAALYTALGVLTSAGVFLFTRVFIPDLLLSLLLAAALYCFLRSLHPASEPPANPNAIGQAASLAELNSAQAFAPNFSDALYPYLMWSALALAVLTKGLVAIVFLFGTAVLFLALTGELHNLRRLKPLTGILLFLAIAAPWHILAGLRNTGAMDGHGFFWFYFVNEHVLRFLGRRIPRDYNKLPGYLYWSLHLVWLFPWSLFALLAVDPIRDWFSRHSEQRPESPYPAPGAAKLRTLLHTLAQPQRTTLLLALFSTVVLLFFSISTNQEYYTFPAYLPLLMLIAAALACAELAAPAATRPSSAGKPLLPDRYSLLPAFSFAHAAFTLLGALVAAALAYGLWISRRIPAPRDIGALLAHRGVGDYTLSMSSLFDLTGPSFAALRLPAALALAAFAIGPAVAWMLRVQRRHLASTLAVALTSATFLIAAHIALVRFTPMLSSADMARTILALERTQRIAPDSTLLLLGDQAYGSSIPFYLDRPLSQPALLVDGRSSSMLFGSTFPDAQYLFLTPAQLLAQWGTGPRKLLFVPLERRDDADRLLAPYSPILLKETSGKALYTDRPLDSPNRKPEPSKP